MLGRMCRRQRTVGCGVEIVQEIREDGIAVNLAFTQPQRVY